MAESIHPQLMRTEREYDVTGAPVISTTIGQIRQIIPIRLTVRRWRDAVPGRSDTVHYAVSGHTLRRDGTAGVWCTINIPGRAPYPQWLRDAIENGDLDS